MRATCERAATTEKRKGDGTGPRKLTRGFGLVALATLLLGAAATPATLTTPASGAPAPKVEQPTAVELTGAGSTFDAPIFLRRLCPLPPAPPRCLGQLRRGGQRRRDQGVLRRVGRLRRIRCPDDGGRAGCGPRRARCPGPRRPRRRGRQLQPGQYGRFDRSAASHGRGAGSHLPRPDHQVGRPGDSGTEPGRQPTGRGDQRPPPFRQERHHLHFHQLPLQRFARVGARPGNEQGHQVARRFRGQRQRGSGGVVQGFARLDRLFRALLRRVR